MPRRLSKAPGRGDTARERGIAPSIVTHVARRERQAYLSRTVLWAQLLFVTLAAAAMAGGARLIYLGIKELESVLLLPGAGLLVGAPLAAVQFIQYYG